MADLSITADPEAINKFLAESILKSQLGQTITEKARAALNDYRFANEVEAAIKGMVYQQAREFVEGNEEFKAQVIAAVSKSMTPELVERVAAEAVAKLTRY